jgi:sugar-specific transcriptional regulator TrmB
MNYRTLIKAALANHNLGQRVVDIVDEIGMPYPNTYQALKGMEADGLIYKITRGVYALSEPPQFTTSECISLLQTLEKQEEVVEQAQYELDCAEAQLKAIKNTIKATMIHSFE